MSRERFIPWLLALFLLGTNGAKLPSNFQKCNYQDANFHTCLAKAVEFGASLLSKPIPSVGLPNLEPLEISSFSIAAGSGPVGVQQNFHNAKMYGLRNIKIQKAEMNLTPGNLSVNFTSEFSKLEILADYQLSGKVLMLPIQGRGKAVLLLKNLTSVEYFPLVTIHKKNKTYIQVSPKGKVTLPKLDLLHVHFENLFNGNRELGETLNLVINENWVSIFDDVRSGYEKLFTEIIVNIFDSFYDRVPVFETIDNFDPKILT